jgi:Predicted integral membrane protein
MPNDDYTTEPRTLIAAADPRAAVHRPGWPDVPPAVWGLAAFLAITALIHVHVTGDTPEYAGAVFDRLQTGRDAPAFWDAGHLLWRPLGYLISALRLRLWPTDAGAMLRVVSHTFIALSLLGGAACAVVLPTWLRQIGVSAWGAFVATLTLVTTNAFLDYYSGGTAYIPGLSFILLGLYLLSAEVPSRLRSVAGGASLAVAVLLWLPFVLALPGALLVPVVLVGWQRARARAVAIATASCATVGLLTYLAVVVHLGIHSVHDFAAWLSGASHGVTTINGLPRAIVGFSRSFLNIGTDGAALKRFMLHDPFNPVSLGDLIPLRVWKIALVYAVALTMLVTIWRSAWRRRLLFCGLLAVPVLAFAVAWQGGDTERYLPLYPAFLLAIGACLSLPRRSIGRVIVELFVVVAVVVNTSAHSKLAFAAEERGIVSRAGAFSPERLPPGSIVVMPTLTDRTISYFLSGAQDTTKIHGDFRFYPLVQQGADNSSRWREDFAAKTLDVWNAGGRVWVSARVLTERPRSDWGWAEGEDRGISWPDFRRFFTTLTLGTAIGGSDGFIELPASAANRTSLETLRQRGSGPRR